MVIHRFPSRRQGISALRRNGNTILDYIARRVLPVYTTQVSDECMESIVVLVIESTLARWLPGLPRSLLTYYQIIIVLQQLIARYSDSEYLVVSAVEIKQQKFFKFIIRHHSLTKT